MNVEVAVKHNCFLGEGPVWNDTNNTIYWVDILRGELHEFNPATTNFKTINVHQFIGAFALCDDGNLLLALQKSLAIINPNTGNTTAIASPEPSLPGNRCNDGKCDPQGRFWIGTMAIDEQDNAGSLYMLNTNNELIQKIEQTTVSNGLAWSLDQQTFYYIDSPTLTVAAYDYNADGNITNRRIAIKINEKDGYPDGMTIDTEGMLWIAHWNGWQVARWNPNTGEKLLSVALPAAHVTSCTFGGDNLQDLYITTAQKGLSEQQLKEQPLAGCLFVCKNIGYQGLPAVRFKTH